MRLSLSTHPLPHQSKPRRTIKGTAAQQWIESNACLPARLASKLLLRMAGPLNLRAMRRAALGSAQRRMATAHGGSVSLARVLGDAVGLQRVALAFVIVVAQDWTAAITDGEEASCVRVFFSNGSTPCPLPP
jgi:hypothetical protein